VSAFLKSVSKLTLLAALAMTVPSWAQEAPKISEEPLELTIHFHFRDKYVYT
tara:strand:- start:35832 stop:35987 length:156 start_codon:yes stop_codon:yes gene_type:complete